MTAAGMEIVPQRAVCARRHGQEVVVMCLNLVTLIAPHCFVKAAPLPVALVVRALRDLLDSATTGTLCAVFFIRTMSRSAFLPVLLCRTPLTVQAMPWTEIATHCGFQFLTPRP